MAQAKATAIAAQHPNALVIGSDQVALHESAILGKPGTEERAIAVDARQIGSLFHGSLSVNTRTGNTQVAVESFSVTFRNHSAAAITRYVRRDQSYDCVGGFVSEGLGIALFSEMTGADPTALVGLPLIRLVTMLAAEGIEIF